MSRNVMDTGTVHIPPRVVAQDCPHRDNANLRSERSVENPGSERGELLSFGEILRETPDAAEKAGEKARRRSSGEDKTDVGRPSPVRDRLSPDAGLEPLPLHAATMPSVPSSDRMTADVGLSLSAKPDGVSDGLGVVPRIRSQIEALASEGPASQVDNTLGDAGEAAAPSASDGIAMAVEPSAVPGLMRDPGISEEMTPAPSGFQSPKPSVAHEESGHASSARDEGSRTPAFRFATGDGGLDRSSRSDKSTMEIPAVQTNGGRLRVEVMRQETHFTPSAPAMQLASPISRALQSVSAFAGLAPAGARLTKQQPQSGPVRMLTIQLQPVRLGTVAVRLVLSNGTMHVRVDTAQPATAELIRQDRAALAGMLQDAGVAVDADAIEIGTTDSDAERPVSETPRDAADREHGGARRHERSAGQHAERQQYRDETADRAPSSLSQDIRAYDDPALADVRRRLHPSSDYI